MKKIQTELTEKELEQLKKLRESEKNKRPKKQGILKHDLYRFDIFDLPINTTIYSKSELEDLKKKVDKIAWKAFKAGEVFVLFQDDWIPLSDYENESSPVEAFFGEDSWAKRNLKNVVKYKGE